MNDIKIPIFEHQFVQNSFVFNKNKRDKYKVYSSQYSYSFGNNQIHFPYSIASLVSYVKQFENIEQKFQFEKVFLFRNNILSDIEKCVDVDILMCSCYSWNWEITTFLAKKVKEKNPNCLVIFGGPEVPRNKQAFFDEYDFIDVLVHGEGEIVLYNILQEYLGDWNLQNVDGIETRNIKSRPQKRMDDLDVIPSPYSSDLIWNLVEKDSAINYVASWETNRGCPFQCFEENTEIITSRCPNKKAKDVEVGDYLKCLNEETQEITETQVIKIFSHKVPVILEISFEDGSVIKVTPEHPFYLNKKWVEARKLSVRDELFEIDHNSKKIIEIKTINKETNVVNFSCYPHENYFANYVLSHNCTFCDWGSATASKVRNFSEDKLFQEIQWFGENNIVYVDVCDGNFGIFADRDYRLATKLVDIKKQYGSPKKIGITWVKTSSTRIIPLAKKLAEADLLRGVSLSVQSLDETTLDIIKRKNIKFDKFEDLIKNFEQEGLRTYTELIMGLPGETLESYKNNWEILAGIEPSPAILTWNCSVFVNAPMNDPEYKKKYEIEVFKSRMYIQHISSGTKSIDEYEYMINKTYSLKKGEINEIYVYNWIMLVFHAFGILNYVARYLRKNMTYTQFYTRLHNYCLREEGSLFNIEYKKVVEHAQKGYNGEGWDHYDSQIGDICWPIEEAGWLRLVKDKKVLYEEMKKFLMEFNLPEPILNDLCNFQLFMINFYNSPETLNQAVEYDWKIFFMNIDSDLQKRKVVYKRKPLSNNNDFIQWCYEIMWFGRREQKTKAKLASIENTNV